MFESPFENQIIIPLFKNLSYKYVESNELLSLRNNDSKEVLIFSEIEEFLKSKNYSNNQISQVISKLNDLKGSDLEIANQQFWKYLVEGIKIQDSKLKKWVTIRLLDSENANKNRFLITNQFKMSSTNRLFNLQFPDVVIYLNGMPISVFELKTPQNDDDEILEKAYTQVKNYQSYLKNLFVYNAFNVISDGNTAKVGTLTASFSRYCNWRGNNWNNSDLLAVPLKNFFNDLFCHKTLLSLITEYTFFTNDHVPQKIMAGYHQYYGVQELKAEILTAMKLSSPPRKGGVFWHAQGSGKSFSMLFLVNQIAKANPGTTFIIVTDRKDLDDQIASTFKKTVGFFTQKMVSINSINHLKHELLNRKQDGIFFTTVQKFGETIVSKNDRRNILVITDEAHRSHNNLSDYLTIASNKEVVSKFGYAFNLRQAFPNATFCGFTGTPIENDDTSTEKVFGRIVSKYTLIDAERDGVIVPIKYESRKPDLVFDEKELATLEAQDEEFNKKAQTKLSAADEIIKKKNKILKKLENFISDQDRIQGVASDFIKHYKARQYLVKGKALFVALNRKIAVLYRKAIIKLEPSWEDKVKIVMTQGNKQTDSKDLIEAAGSVQDRKNLAIEFKKPDSEFKIAIVVDMWSTGFDVPALDTLYLDKPLKMHNLMQTITRTNRVYNNKKEKIVKECGVVIDYIGIWNNLGKALAFYANKKNTDDFLKTRDLTKLRKSYNELLDSIIRNYLQETKFDPHQAIISDYNEKLPFVKQVDFAYINDKKDSGANEVLKAHKSQDFITATKPLAKYFQEVAAVINHLERIKYHFVLLVRQLLIKLALEKVNFSDVKNDMLAQLEKAIKYDRTIVIDEVRGTPIKLADIVTFFDKKVKETNRFLGVMEKHSALNMIIKEVRKVNLVRASSLSKDLKNLMQKYENGHLTIQDLEENLIYFKNQALATIENSEDDGFSREERAFFEILDKPLEQSDYDKEKLRLILNDLLVILNNDAKVNKQWVFNKILVKKIRGDIKILLRKHHYPPEKVESSVNDIIDQIMITREYEE